ncbi:plastocyanin/azurin family copper-binding protein [Solirubrobacter taibaiensis]|nr:plastocyanin/azurin family copper-binding protein [Solirubrobacter taibaiensis]
MKRALALGFGLALFAAAPAQADNQTIDGRADLTWDKPNVVVAVGETVTWTFSDTSQNHNVQSDVPDLPDTAWNNFASPIGLPAQPASYTFTQEGVYKFICVVHTSTMTGTVTVGSAGPPPPPPLSAQQFGNDDATPVVLEKVSVDKAKPKVSSVSAKRGSKRGSVRVRFKVNEQSDVRVRLKRGGKVVKTVIGAGTGAGFLDVTGVKAGRYSVEVLAIDVAGNRASLKKTSVTVR